MSDGLPYAGDPLELLLMQAGIHVPSTKIQGMPKHFLSQPAAVDPTNQMNQQGVGTGGVQVDPRYTQAVQQMFASGPGDVAGVPTNFLSQSGNIPPVAPMVGVEQKAAHPTLLAIAQGISSYLQQHPIDNRAKGKDAFLGGLLGGASNAMLLGDQKRQATNEANRQAAAQMNLMNAATSAAKATGGLTPDAAAKAQVASEPIQLGTQDLENLQPYLSADQQARGALGKLTRAEYDRAMGSASLDLRKHPSVRAGNATMPTAPLSDEALNQAADTYWSTGNFSGVSARDMEARRQIMNRSALRHAGANIVLNAAETKANAASLAGVQKSADASAVFINQLHKNVAMIEPLLAQMSDTGSPFFNKPLRDVQSQVFGAEDIPAYNFVMETVRKEANRILTAGPSMAGQVGEGEQKAMRSVIDGNATAAQLRQTVGVVLKESENRTLAYQQQIADIKGRLGKANVPSGNQDKIAVIGPGNVRGWWPKGVPLKPGYSKAN